MRTAQREPWRANGTLLEPGPLISQAKKKWPQALRSGELPRRQGQANGLPRGAVHRRRPGWEARSAEGWAVWETGHGCPVSMRNFAVLPTRLGSSPPQALQEYGSRQPSPIIDSGF